MTCLSYLNCLDNYKQGLFFIWDRYCLYRCSMGPGVIYSPSLFQLTSLRTTLVDRCYLCLRKSNRLLSCRNPPVRIKQCFYIPSLNRAAVSSTQHIYTCLDRQYLNRKKTMWLQQPLTGITCTRDGTEVVAFLMMNPGQCFLCRCRKWEVLLDCP